MNQADFQAARLAIDEYNVAYEQGGELPYPHWADEIIAQAKAAGELK